MRELSLFTGIGGGLLAAKLLGWQTVCGVEINEYCQKVIKQRQRDGFLDQFPMFSDIRTFSGTEWRGKVDTISGGFPCQPFSRAARGRNNAIDFWPEMRRIIGEVQPRFVFAENVAADPIKDACRDLNTMGYDCRYTCLSASDLGAPHDRKRYWLVANSDANSEPRRTVYVKTSRSSETKEMEWWSDNSRAMGVLNGDADLMDTTRRPRLQALGNGQVPIVAAVAFTILSRTFKV